MTDHTNDDPSTWPPQFIEAATEAHYLTEAHGEAALCTPEHMHLLETMEAHAPTPKLKAIASDLLRTSRYAQASREMERIAAEHGREALCEPEHAHLLAQLMLNAPREFLDTLSEKAREMDLLPTASHVDEDGNPVYTSLEIAEKFGLSVEQVESDIRALGLDATPARAARRLQ